jgi:Fur family ferric uptake transcriptional regulator
MGINGYKTRQRDQILQYLTEHRQEHITADDLVEAFRAQNVKVGKSTIYRYLDVLVQGGQLRKYTIDESSSACYQYVENPGDCATHFHLKCMDCGRLLHIQSDLLPVVSQEIKSQYGFSVDQCKTVLYGRCKACHTEEEA